MAILTIPNLKLQIDAEINTNGIQAITGAILNKNLIDSVDSILDAAISAENGIFSGSNNGATIPASMVVDINDTLSFTGGDISLGVSNWLTLNSTSSTTAFGGLILEESAGFGGRIYQNGQSDRLTITAYSGGVDTGGIYIDRGTGRVGIQRGAGGFAPQATLHLKGEALIDSLKIEDSLGGEWVTASDSRVFALAFNAVFQVGNFEAKTQFGLSTSGFIGHNLNNFAILQTSAGLTALNSGIGQVLDFRINNSVKWSLLGNSKLQGNTELGMKISLYSDAGSDEYGFGVISGGVLQNILPNVGTPSFEWVVGTSASNAKLMTLKDSGVLNFSSMPTSSAGLSSGDLWNNSGVVNIV